MSITPEESNRLYRVLWKAQARWRGSSGSVRRFFREIHDDLLSEIAQFSALPGLAAYEETLATLDRMSVAYILNAFSQMGFEFEPQTSFSRTDITSQLRVIDRYHKLLERLLNILAEEGILRQEKDRWTVIATPGDIELQGQVNAPSCAEAEAASALLTRCGSRLAEVLQGRCSALSLLFPDADMSDLARLYRTSPEIHFMNGLVGKAVLSAVKRLDRVSCCRILEIGAGTGSTTSQILPHLCGHNIEYLFTDVAHIFLNRAKIEFKDYPFLSYRLLDIEREVQSQGFGLQQYDIIVAANVLHATGDLRQTLHNIRQLLAPGGILVLMEVTAPVPWIDLVFGLTDGWWQFRDLDLRPSYPLISSIQWKALLTEAGFVDSFAVSPEDVQESAQRKIIPHALIFACNPIRDACIEFPENWLIFADRTGLGEKLKERLGSAKDTCTLVYSGRSFKELKEERTFILNPAEPGHFRRLLKRLGNPPRTIVHLWSLDIPPLPVLSAIPAAAGDRLSYNRALDEASMLNCGSILHMIQAVSEEYYDPPSLWLVTRGAQFVEACSGQPAIAQSSLWGMAKVIALEHPEPKCVRVDLDPNDNGNEDRGLFEEIACGPDIEDQLAFRNETRYVARLSSYHESPCHPVSETCPGPGTAVTPNKHGYYSFKENASYLITGGLGGLGLLVAHWMVERGARFLTLVGRSGIGETANAKLKEMEKAGARISIARADVSDVDQVEQLLADIEDELPPLRGIVHAAGIIDDDLILRLSWERFMKVIAPKVKGAWHLHSLTVSRGMSLDFFVLFSSIASMVGNAGQAGYAAANSFMDCLALYRRAGGLPGLSINWGAWSQEGIVANNPAIAEWLKGMGIDSIDPEQYLKAFEFLLSQTHAQVGVVSCNWSKFKQHYRLKEAPFFDLLNSEQ